MAPPRPAATSAAAARDPGSSATAASTPRKLTAFTPNTHAGPPWASSTPASAGPTKRATCKSSELIATALSRSSRGTEVASIPWKAGNASVPSEPPTTAIAPISATVRAPVCHSTARAAATTMLSPWNSRISRRLS